MLNGAVGGGDGVAIPDQEKRASDQIEVSHTQAIFQLRTLFLLREVADHEFDRVFAESIHTQLQTTMLREYGLQPYEYTVKLTSGGELHSRAIVLSMIDLNMFNSRATSFSKKDIAQFAPKQRIVYERIREAVLQMSTDLEKTAGLTIELGSANVGKVVDFTWTQKITLHENRDTKTSEEKSQRFTGIFALAYIAENDRIYREQLGQLRRSILEKVDENAEQLKSIFAQSLGTTENEFLNGVKIESGLRGVHFSDEGAKLRVLLTISLKLNQLITYFQSSFSESAEQFARVLAEALAMEVVVDPLTQAGKKDNSLWRKIRLGINGNSSIESEEFTYVFQIQLAD